MMNRSVFRAVSSALALTLLLAGCGGAAAGASPQSSTIRPATSSSAGMDASPASKAVVASETAAASGTAASDAKVFTKDTLAQFDGQNGNAAYVAVNGTVYDVTNVPQWNNGSHQGNKAGMDLTDAIGRSPHGLKVLENLPVVGTYE